MYENGYIPSFLRTPARPAGLKETLSVLMMAFGIAMLVAMVVCALNVFLKNAYVGSFHIGLFLFPNPFLGRGFELPFFLAKPFDSIIGIHIVIADCSAKILKDNYLAFFFFIGPFFEEMEWRGIFWLTRNHSSKSWWKISFLISCFLFALAHPKGIGWMLCPFAIAVTNGIIISRTKKFWPVFINHFLFNVAVIFIVSGGG